MQDLTCTPLLATSQLILHPQLPSPLLSPLSHARGSPCRGSPSPLPHWASLTMVLRLPAAHPGPGALQQPLAVPPHPCIPPAPIAAVSVTLGVSSGIEQTQRDEQRQGLVLLWGRVPVSGAQLLLGLSLALPFSSAFGSPPCQGGTKEQHEPRDGKMDAPLPLFLCLPPSTARQHRETREG